LVSGRTKGAARKATNFIVVETESASLALAEIADVAMAFKNTGQTFRGRLPNSDIHCAGRQYAFAWPSSQDVSKWISPTTRRSCEPRKYRHSTNPTRQSEVQSSSSSLAPSHEHNTAALLHSQRQSV
jgi:hypothetical protein